MAIEVFNRYENKYLIKENICGRLQNRLVEYMELDEYNKQNEVYPIANIYYDTSDNQLIRTSLSKPEYKEKLRLRSYGIPGSNGKVYVEIKKKVAGLVNKRRSTMKLSEATEFLTSGIMPNPEPYMNAQVLREIEYLLSRYELYPALCLSYDRRAYFGIGQHDLRISFDTNIKARRYDFDLRMGLYGEPILDEGTWLMEIKSSQSIPVWLSRLLSEYKIFPTSFSKYGQEYKQMVSAQQKNPVFTPVFSTAELIPGSVFTNPANAVTV